MSDGGKGSKPRPFSVTQEEYASRWDMIFGRDQPSEREEKITRNNEETQEAARWVYSGLSPHNGEYYYKCKVCKEEDWIASYGTLDQLRCRC